VGADTLVLGAFGMPDNAAVYFQGTSRQAAGAGTTFGDGLRCAGGTVRRLGTTMNALGSSAWPGPSDPGISVQGLVMAGDTRTYPCWYRDAATFCTSATFNLTNGWLVRWAP